MKLIPLYRAMLDTIAMTATADGYISVKRGAKATNPVTIESRRLVLPTSEQLSNREDPTWKERVAFHPLYENTARGESDVMVCYRQNANFFLNARAGMIAYLLLQVVTSTAEHAKLDGQQANILSILKHADADLMEKFTDLLDKMDGDRCMVNIYIRKGAMVNGKKHSRAGIVTFPLYEELVAAKGELRGVKLRTKQKDRETLMALLEYIFPKIAEPHAYDYGSDSGLSPTMDAFMHAMLGVIADLNNVVEMFKGTGGTDIADEWSKMEIPVDWLEAFDSLGNLKSEIYSVPQLMGNEGSVAKTDLPAPAAQPAAPAPVPQPQPAAPVAPAQVAPPVYQQPYPPQPQVPYPQPGYPAPGYPYQPPPQQHPQYQQPQGNGRDFDSMMRNNPWLAQNMTMVMGQPGMAAPGMAQQPSNVRGSMIPGAAPAYGNQPYYPGAPVYGSPF